MLISKTLRIDFLKLIGVDPNLVSLLNSSNFPPWHESSLPDRPMGLG